MSEVCEDCGSDINLNVIDEIVLCDDCYVEPEEEIEDDI